MASSKAVSVPGRMGIHSTSPPVSMSSRTGLMLTKRTPASAMRRSPVGMVCSVAPPELTWAFLAGTPPKLMNSCVCRAMMRQLVCWVNSSSMGATMCGISTRAAPRL